MQQYSDYEVLFPFDLPVAAATGKSKGNSKHVVYRIHSKHVNINGHVTQRTVYVFTTILTHNFILSYDVQSAMSFEVL